LNWPLPSSATVILIGVGPDACCAKQLPDNIKMVSKSFTLLIPFAGTHASGVLSLDIVEGPPAAFGSVNGTPEACVPMSSLFPPRFQLAIQSF
jgi:hypothetical protein